MVNYTGNFLLGLPIKAHGALPLQGRELQAWIWALALPTITCLQLIVGDSYTGLRTKEYSANFPKNTQWRDCQWVHVDGHFPSVMITMGDSTVQTLLRYAIASKKKRGNIWFYNVFLYLPLGCIWCGGKKKLKDSPTYLIWMPSFSQGLIRGFQ